MTLYIMTLRLTVLLLAAIFVMADEDWQSKCGQCKCLWSDGKKTADCKSRGLSTIPSDMSYELRDIDFSLNPLYELGTNVFRAANLHDTHKLKLQNCSILTIHQKAFEGLRLLIELDLSRNDISKLDENVFRDNAKLRILYLNYNRIRELRGSLFFNMTHLQKVEMHHNQIEFVDSNVFNLDSALKYLDLNSNKLKTLDSALIQNLDTLSSLSVQSNPWICDCKLQKFKDLATKRNLITSPTTCDEPPRLKGRLWSDLLSRDFACVPQIIYPTLSDNRIVQSSVNYTISCLVEGDPAPDVVWVTNGRILEKDPHQNSQKYITTISENGNKIWRNLTIIHFNHRDKGEYKCQAKNPGGEVERNITLSSDGGSGAIFGSGSSGNLFSWIIGLSIGAIILLIFICVLICICCKRNNNRRRGHAKGADMTQSSDYISLNGRPETEKPIITDVNPISKPPRQYSVPPSVTSGATEVSDLKRVLLDDDSTIAADDESRSFDFETRLPIRHQQHLDVDYRDNVLPPDLLSFPPRAMQISPAGSIASTVAIDHARLPAYLAPQSPLHSPHYDTIYRTLPYSKSQSPFTTPLGPPVLAPRQGGYVTIPRRPRSSWSSEPPTPEISEPVYDNLGLRTTAAGNSALSLNKLGINGTPKQNRSVNPSVASYTCDPIAEHDSLPTAATLPRSASAHRAVSPVSNYRHPSWRTGSDTTSVRSSELPDSRRESTASLLPTPDGKITKIPPRPPPKPKKRTSTGPLFEDEGEHGTEV